MLLFRCLDSTLTIITYLSSNVNIFKETTSGNLREKKKNYSLCSDHLAIAKLFSEWNSTQNLHYATEPYNDDNISLSKTSLTLMYSKYYIHIFYY